MKFTKRKIKTSLRRYFNGNLRYNLTETEKKKAITRGNQIVDLFFNIKRDGFFTGIKKSHLKRELKTLHQLQLSISGLNNMLLEVARDNKRIFLCGESTVRKFDVSGDNVVMVLLLTYAASCELVLKLLKNVIDFERVNNTLPRHKRKNIDNKKLTLSALSVLETKYNTKAFKDIDKMLRNKIDHLDFEYTTGKKFAGIKYHYYDPSSRKMRIKRYSLLKVMKEGRKVNILLISTLSVMDTSFF